MNELRPVLSLSEVEHLGLTRLTPTQAKRCLKYGLVRMANCANILQLHAQISKLDGRGDMYASSHKAEETALTTRPTNMKQPMQETISNQCRETELKEQFSSGISVGKKNLNIKVDL